MNEYLDTKKSVIISAPAGSGKTEKLARRYISLLEDGTGIEKILAITFTEKAAAEMKDRILNILLKEKTELFNDMKEKVPLMRITTIHAFCRKLITRFSMELGLDPSLEVLDDFSASQLWSEAVHDTLRDENENPSLFFEYLKQKGLKGWDALRRTLDAVHDRRPWSEFLLGPDVLLPGHEEGRLIELYRKCFYKYRSRKLELRSIDFDDMEVLAYRAITSNPEWLNILYAFDEHTDHILVDEFQDTNSLQWKIIDKLTEEWRSGLGAKRSGGKTPTIFLVGDEKQSIYMFRGADVSIFHEVKTRFKEWLGKEALFIEAEENYRSLPGIINFTNCLFEQLMSGPKKGPWCTNYSKFFPTREGDSVIELLLLEYSNDSKQSRRKEASFAAKKILSITGTLDIYSDGQKRKCRYSDIAILLRKRTHLLSFESSLRENNIPYVVVGGIGFYNEPEVALMRELVCFLADPYDDFSLFALLRSPLFPLSGSKAYNLALGRKKSLFSELCGSKDTKTLNTCRTLKRYLEQLGTTTLAVLLEDFLAETEGWKIFWEPQRHANIKKFLRIIENYESEGSSLVEIRENLLRLKNSNESKANLNTETLDAVKVMTVHGAKGLQFPVVFLPSMDEADSSGNDSVFIDEIDNKIIFSFEEDLTSRKKNDIFLLRKEKEKEEEKRLFYVAITRAMDHLFMSGILKKADEDKIKLNGRMDLIEKAFPSSITGENYKGAFEVVREKELGKTYERPAIVFSQDSKKFFSEPVYTEAIVPDDKISRWFNVTEETEIRTKHGQDWVSLGILFHRLFEEISKSSLDYLKLSDRLEILLKNDISLKSNPERYRRTVLNDFKKLEDSGLLKEVIMPDKNSFTELPFTLQKDNRIYKGRIDRIIIKNDTAYIYDYKTFPVSSAEIEELRGKYNFQMKIYSEACRDLFSLKTKSFILFTHKPVVVEV